MFTVILAYIALNQWRGFMRPLHFLVRLEGNTVLKDEMIMDIYIAQRVYDYQGFKIIGVFDDLEQAKAACQNDALDKDSNGGDSWDVTYHYLKKA